MGLGFSRISVGYRHLASGSFWSANHYQEGMFPIPSFLENKDLPTRSDAGRRWLIKALHPAEASIKAPKAPGTSRYPTVVQEIVSTFQLNAPPSITATQTWDGRIVVHSDPLNPLEFFHGVTGDTEYFNGSYLNQAFFKSDSAYKVHTLAELGECYDSFTHACETYRVNALSTTGVFVGATMTDQGSVLASQFVDCTRDISMTGGDKECRILGNVWVDPLPSMSEAALGQRPYVGDAREGWYCPQKMSQPGHWQRTNDIAMRGRLMLPDNPASFDMADCQNWPITQGHQSGMSLWVRTYDDSCSQIFLKGLSATTSFRVTLRMVIEMGVTPNNDFAAFATDPAYPDESAYGLYMTIVNELQDAYPADYNDLGRLWGKVKTIAKRVASFVDPIAGIAAAVGVPFASTVQGIAKGVAGDAKKFINAKEDGLKAAVDELKAEKKALDAAKAEKQRRLAGAARAGQKLANMQAARDRAAIAMAKRRARAAMK